MDKDNKIIGISSAARLLGWNVGKFASYYYRSAANIPIPEMMDNQPIWKSDALLHWRDTNPFRGKGRPKKSPC